MDDLGGTGTSCGDEAIADFMLRCDGGETVDRDAFLAAHPGAAGALRDYFSGCDLLGSLLDSSSAPGADAAGDPPATLPLAAADTAVEVERKFGEYELVDAIASGGMGVVYRAHQASLSRVVALKMVLGGDEATPADLRRFHAEAEAAASLDHPNIVPIYDVGWLNGVPYYSMKLVEGGTLAARAGEFRADPRRTATLMAQLARAVHYAHQRGILHRDLKPANVLLDADGRPYLTDFGLAKRIETKEGDGSALTLKGAVVGTPGYMAPEQADGARNGLTTAADVYGLGAILYHLLAGRAPFVGRTRLETLLQVLEDEPDPPRRHNPAADPDLATICQKCVEKDPNRRYASAMALAEDLERWLEGRTITARPASAGERAVKWARRHPTVATLAGVTVATAVLAFAGVAFAWRKAETRAVAEATAKDETRAALALARLRDYYRGVSLAERCWWANDVRHARHLLAAVPTDLRGWEWNYLDRLCNAEPWSERRHGGFAIHGAAFSPDGKFVASMGADSQLHYSDLDGRILWTRPASVGFGRQLAFRPDGRHLAAVAPGEMRDNFMGRTVEIRQSKTGELVRRLVGHRGGVSAVAYAPDGSFLATASLDGTVRLWDAETGKPRKTFAAGKSLWCVAVGPDNATVVAGSDDEFGTVHVWDRTGQKPPRPLALHEAMTTGVAISPDGRLLASSSWDETIQLWNLQTNRHAGTLAGHNGVTYGMSFDPASGRLSTTSCDQTIRVWDTKKLREERALRGHLSAVNDSCFGPDGRIVSASSDGSVRLWDPSRPQEAAEFADNAMNVAYSPDGKLLVAAGQRYALVIRDAATHRELRRVEGVGKVVAFAPDGDRLAAASAGGGVEILDAADGKSLFRLPDWDRDTCSIAFGGAGGNLVAAAGRRDNAVRLWDLAAGGSPVVIPCARRDDFQGVRAVALGGDRYLAAIAGNRVMLWDTIDAQRIRTLEGHVEDVGCLAFSPGGKLLASAAGYIQGAPEILVWDPATGELKATLRGTSSVISGMAFSPDGRRLAAASFDKTIKLWDVENAEEVITLHGHRGAVSDVAFSTDGLRLASVAADGCVRVWDATPRRPERVKLAAPATLSVLPH